jgi:NAD(P)-dependent dehydrogenase (short-subunit alcohol dehydrogenase family)
MEDDVRRCFLETPDVSQLLGLSGKPFVLLGGAKVFCIDRDQSVGNLVADQTDADAFCADALVRESLSSAFEVARHRHGQLQGVVNLIGMATLQLSLAFDDEQWTSQFDIVVRRAFLTLQVASDIAGGVFSGLRTRDHCDRIGARGRWRARATGPRLGRRAQAVT